jgi:hypothetical protein
VNNPNQPVKSSDSRFENANYSPHFPVKNAGGEQVLVVTLVPCREKAAHEAQDLLCRKKRLGSLLSR